MNALTKTSEIAKASEIAEAVLLRGDYGKMTERERAQLVVRMCESLGLNPLTRPISFIMLSGKLVPYANKDCTEQLRKIHKVSVTSLETSEREGLYVVTAKVSDRDGRTDAATGAVTIKGLQGDARANAVMKAETKAKRRATLSICGLGFLDESELETIPDSAKRMQRLPKKDARTMYSDMQTEMAQEKKSRGLTEWWEAAQTRIQTLPEEWEDILRLEFQGKLNALQMQEAAGESDEPPHDPETGEVIWDENEERPIADADEPAEDDDIPGFLRREQPSVPFDRADYALTAAAAKGMDALKTTWESLSPDNKNRLKAALDRRHKPAALQADRMRQSA